MIDPSKMALPQEHVARKGVVRLGNDCAQGHLEEADQAGMP
jgi:hypothetical protein